MCLNKAFRRSLEFIVLQFYSLKKNSQGVEPLYHKGYNPAELSRILQNLLVIWFHNNLKNLGNSIADLNNEKSLKVPKIV
jgi:hypothetical protein